VIADGMGQAYWKARHGSISLKDPGLGYHQVWREIAPRPKDVAEAQQVLAGVIAREIGRLEALLAEYELLAAAEIADRAAFDGTAEFDRLRRCQTARARELLRTIDLMLKLRTTEPEMSEGNRTNGRHPAAPGSQNGRDDVKVDRGAPGWAHGQDGTHVFAAPSEARMKSTQIKGSENVTRSQGAAAETEGSHFARTDSTVPRSREQGRRERAGQSRLRRLTTSSQQRVGAGQFRPYDDGCTGSSARQFQSLLKDSSLVARS
jgi:hypothetical protein